MGVPDAKRLKELELENGRLKRLLADAALDNAALKDLLDRKW
jgi:putative transposase